MGGTGIEQSQQDSANNAGHRYWQDAWTSVQAVEAFSIHSQAVEDAKWRHLLYDLQGRSKGIAVEVGCGSGHFGALLAAHGFDVVLLDYSPAALACAMKSFTSLPGRHRKRYVLADALELPFSDGTVDLIVSCGVLEHFQRPLFPVLEMARVLKPGGILYADICPDRFSLLRMAERMYPRAEGWYEARMNLKDIRSLVENAGLQVMRLFAAGVLPPRSFPGTGRIAPLRWLQRVIVKSFAKFWASLDDTLVADVLGFYYYVTAKKPPCCDKAPLSGLEISK